MPYICNRCSKLFLLKCSYKLHITFKHPLPINNSLQNDSLACCDNNLSQPEISENETSVSDINTNTNNNPNPNPNTTSDLEPIPIEEHFFTITPSLPTTVSLASNMEIQEVDLNSEFEPEFGICFMNASMWDDITK